jgi:bifunctional oxygenase/reductase
MIGSVIETQVVVVGAGPVGLMLAGELRLGGADVVVLDRLPEPTTESRASTLHARTMELFESRGLCDALGDPPNDMLGHFGGIGLDLTLPSPYPGQWKVPQTSTEAVLARWASGLGARLLRGHELWELTEHTDRVEAETTGPEGPVLLRADYLVGCDGEDSTVGLLIGGDYPGHRATRQLVRADVSGIDIPNRRFQRLPAGLAIAARRPDGITRVMVHEFGHPPVAVTGIEDFGVVRDCWKRVTGEDISAGLPLWVNAFDDVSRQAQSYRSGRVLLAGDAAHQQMPIGGQALNLGLQDAVNLGWKLALTVTGRGPAGLLDTYHAERHPVAARVLANIRAQAQLLLGGPEVDDLRAVFAEVIETEGASARLAGMISGLDVSYPAGPETGPLVGARLPPMELLTEEGRSSTGRLLRSGRGLLLDLSGQPDTDAHLAVRRACAPWADRVELVCATPAPGASAPAAELVLVRPDGYLAWASTSEDREPEPALRRWFGSPSVHRRTPAVTYRRTQMSRLTGRTALVTGASRGIGQAIATRLAADGALVAVHYSTGEQQAKQTVADIERDGGRAFGIRAELGVPGDVHQLFLALEDGLKERTGSTELSILVNNAGVMGGVAMADTTPEQFDRLVAVNAKAPFFLIQRAMANLPDGGRIINISSGLTHFANPDELAYAMTKGAVEQLALHLAKLLGPRGITVNSVAPGITRNGNPVFDMPAAVEQMAALSAFNRVGEPDDIADVVAFLASDDARWITGAFLDASGGTLLG